MSIDDRWMMRCETRSFGIFEMCRLSPCDMERLIWSPLVARFVQYALQAASDLGSSHRRLHSDRFSKRLTVGIAGTHSRRIRPRREGGDFQSARAITATAVQVRRK